MVIWREIRRRLFSGSKDHRKSNPRKLLSYSAVIDKLDATEELPK